jgi:hypothetical protein
MFLAAIVAVLFLRRKHPPRRGGDVGVIGVIGIDVCGVWFNTLIES